MAQKLLFIIIGAAVGVVAGWLIAKEKTVEAPPEKDPAVLEQRIEDMERVASARLEKIADLEERLTAATARADSLESRVAEIKEPAAVPEPEVVDPKKPPTWADIEKAMKKFGDSFQAHMVGKAEEAEKELTALLQRADDATMKKLMSSYDEESDIMKKLYIAHLLGLSHRPEALKHLEEIVADQEKSMMDRRLASHGLAFSGAAGLDPTLRKIAEEDADRGVRANAAFGLYRRGNEAGIDLYFKAVDDAFEQKDPMAAQYVGGLLIMDERALPAARERLTKYKDWQTRIMIIEYIKGQKDRESLSTLQNLANDENENASVRKAAQGAIKVIEAAE